MNTSKQLEEESVVSIYSVPEQFQNSVVKSAESVTTVDDDLNQANQLNELNKEIQSGFKVGQKTQHVEG